MKLAICNEMFEGWEWDRICGFAREVGYSGIEVAPFMFSPHAGQIDRSRRKQIRDTAERHGLQIVGLHWLLAQTTGFHLTSPDTEVRRRTADYFRELIDLCGDLGGQVMVIGSPKQRNLLPDVTREQGMSFAQEIFASCLHAAENRGVVLALEPLGLKETTFIQTAAEAIELVKRVNHPWFRINLDVKAMSDEATGIPEIIRSAAPYLEHVQVNDPNLLGPGMGEVDYGPIIAALRDVGYDHWLSVEAFDFRPEAEVIARQSIEYLRRFVKP